MRVMPMFSGHSVVFPRGCLGPAYVPGKAMTNEHDDCVDTLDFCACTSWLDHSTGADHRSRAFQITPSVALSLSLSLESNEVAISTFKSVPIGVLCEGQQAHLPLAEDASIPIASLATRQDNGSAQPQAQLNSRH